MRLSIIVPDNVVVIDGRPESVDLKDMPKGIRAVQWDGSIGHVEHYGQANTSLDHIDEHQWVIDAWKAAAAESDRKKQAMQDKIDLEAEEREIKEAAIPDNLARLAREAEVNKP